MAIIHLSDCLSVLVCAWGDPFQKLFHDGLTANKALVSPKGDDEMDLLGISLCEN